MHEDVKRTGKVIKFYVCYVGEILAKDLDCSFAEVAASEQVTQVAEVFHEVSSYVSPPPLFLLPFAFNFLVRVFRCFC